MDRRHFIRFGFAAIGTTVVAPRIVLASAVESPMAGGVYHTEDAPGRWSKKVLSHLPNVEVEKQQQVAYFRLRQYWANSHFHNILGHLYCLYNAGIVILIYTGRI